MLRIRPLHEEDRRRPGKIDPLGIVQIEPTEALGL